MYVDEDAVDVVADDGDAAEVQTVVCYVYTSVVCVLSHLDLI